MKPHEIDGYWDKDILSVKSDWIVLPKKLTKAPPTDTDSPFSVVTAASKKLLISKKFSPYVKSTLSYLEIADWVPGPNSDQILTTQLWSLVYVLKAIEPNELHYTPVYFHTTIVLGKYDLLTLVGPLDLIDQKLECALTEVEQALQNLEQQTKEKFPGCGDNWCVQWKHSALPKVIIPSKQP